MINSRLITELTPEAQAYFQRLVAHAQSAGLVWGTDWKVISTYRDQEAQDALYAQGRTTPGKIVTHTLKSRHTDREAWDVAIFEVGKIVWVSKKYERLAEIGRSIGLVCGYFWPGKTQDPGHMQLP
jgi:peptidoglycan L-alanyl-D-glutamate endopeptidase CwlK